MHIPGFILRSIVFVIMHTMSDSVDIKDSTLHFKPMATIEITGVSRDILKTAARVEDNFRPNNTPTPISATNNHND